jgi:hypothetical protein
MVTRALEYLCLRPLDYQIEHKDFETYNRWRHWTVHPASSSALHATLQDPIPDPTSIRAVVPDRTATCQKGKNVKPELPLREPRLLVCRLEPVIDTMWVMEFAFTLSRFIHLHPAQCNARLTEARPTPLLASDFQPTDRGGQILM